MKITSTPWPSQSYLKALRPEPGAGVELALLAAYSADPVAIVAALLALVARDNDDTDGSRRDLADAIETLRGKARIVVQRGRLAKMRHTPRLTGVLDQFLREVPFDEREGSWHPKAALIRFCGVKASEWRLWVGSRNLTAPENLDVGLVLVGGGRQGRVIPGVEGIAHALAVQADLPGVRPDHLAAEVAALRWRAPAGTRIDSIFMAKGDGRSKLPTLPRRVDALTVVSPFIDATFLNHVAKTEVADGRRILLSTTREIERLAATTARFGALYALDAPDYPSSDPGSPVAETAGAALLETETLNAGLHAKLLHFRMGTKRKLWLGSANATARAWTGRNVEIIVQASITETIEAGLLVLLGSARTVDPIAHEKLVDVALEADVLDVARSQVASAWRAGIRIDDTGLTLVHAAATPHPHDLTIHLEVGLITGDFAPWPRGQQEIAFGQVPRDQQTELIQLAVSKDGLRREWMQRAPAEPPLGPDRDRAAFVRLLGVRGFLLWIAGLLVGIANAGDDDSWTSDELPPARPPSTLPAWRVDQALPTLEEILGAWARDRNGFDRADRRIRDYLPAVLEQAVVDDPAGHAQLEAFKELWTMVRHGLGTRR
ncbi:hypothetical protein C7I87_11485 [Mesorhizobium sp. SARCC-RB16n]|uniref:phospholipase D family protein n=1 Tax=Mesorhizobium sp. SARCC-RB16n TaxID=2116687 RepID=UPI00122F1588|nr:phospholipase D family protein [Mesorhizobium sp. SARCC-RB16n]KAA3450268.1 hypothetical protein C7I87_11485 [Mesorhizobium sp. SARCC-RB16n]